MTAARVSGPVVPRAASPSQKFLARAIVLAIRAAATTLRLRLEDPGGVLKLINERAVIFALWHNRLAFAPILYRRFTRDPDRSLCALISASRDGALLAAVLESFRIRPVRGSSSRRGAQALLELNTRAQEGCDIAITPDGPRGPRYSVHPGVVAVARLTGMPIIPVAANASRRVDLRSWDRFQLPLPCSSVAVRLGSPLWVPPEAELTVFQERLSSQLMELTRD